MKPLWCMLLFSVTAYAIILSKPHTFTRLLRVTPANHDLYTLDSNYGIQNHMMCAKHCKEATCLSFSYTTVDKRCVIYSRWIETDNNANFSESTMYFSKVFSDCSKIPNGFPSGVYRITTTQGNVFDALCDMETAGGPWTVIQNRINGEEDFYRNWSDYKSGFGDLYGSFWIGNDILHLLTRTPRILRVELKVWNGVKGYAHYSTFQVANEDQNYTLLVNGLSGNITSDAMDKDDGIAFSTFDRDNDENPDFNIAEMRQSGWWHKAQNGTRANLNGRLLSDKKEPKKAMTWVRFPDQNIFYVPLKTTMMLIQ